MRLIIDYNAKDTGGMREMRVRPQHVILDNKRRHSWGWTVNMGTTSEQACLIAFN